MRERIEATEDEFSDGHDKVSFEKNKKAFEITKFKHVPKEPEVGRIDEREEFDDIIEFKADSVSILPTSIMFAAITSTVFYLALKLLEWRLSESFVETVGGGQPNVYFFMMLIPIIMFGFVVLSIVAFLMNVYQLKTEVFRYDRYGVRCNK